MLFDCADRLTQAAAQNRTSKKSLRMGTLSKRLTVIIDEPDVGIVSEM
jgi:hypothetical protein